ncbi:hypothetical protein AB0H12_23795 [Actinosynnema sp. NPDC023794]
MSASLRLAVRHAAVLTTALARTRGHVLISGDAFLAMSGPTLLRVLAVRPDPDPDDVAEQVVVEGFPLPGFPHRQRAAPRAEGPRGLPAARGAA